jgi:Putative sensor
MSEPTASSEPTTTGVSPQQVLAVFAQRRTWKELTYALIGLPLGVAGFTFTVTTLSVSAGLAITLVGLPLLVLSNIAARVVGRALGATANALVDAHVEPPPSLHRRPGVLGLIGAHLRDPVAWRAHGYLLLKLPLGLATAIIAATSYAIALGAATYAAWRPFLPRHHVHGVDHRGMQLWNGHYVDSLAPIGAVTVAGVALLLATPWIVRAVVALDRSVTRALLAPTRPAAAVPPAECEGLAAATSALVLSRTSESASTIPVPASS